MGCQTTTGDGQLVEQQRTQHVEICTCLLAPERLLDGRQQDNLPQPVGIQDEVERVHEVKPLLLGHRVHAVSATANVYVACIAPEDYPFDHST